MKLEGSQGYIFIGSNFYFNLFFCKLGYTVNISCIGIILISQFSTSSVLYSDKSISYDKVKLKLLSFFSSSLLFYSNSVSDVNYPISELLSLSKSI